MAYAFVRSLFPLSLIIVGLAAFQLTGCGSPEERAQAHYERGMELFKEKDYVRATLELKNALQLDGKIVGAWMALSQIEERNQKWEAVATILRKVIELDPSHIEARTRLAKLTLLAGETDEALRLANAAIELDNQNAAALALRAAILFKLGDRNAAREQAEAALEIDPANSDALVTLAAYRFVRGDAEGALLVLARKPKTETADLGIQLIKLRIYEHMKDARQIETLLKEMVEDHPKEDGFRRLLVRFYVQNDRKDDAEQQMRAITAARPADIQAGLDLVRFLFAVRGRDAALEELRSRIKAGGDIFPYQMALADFHRLQGNIGESIALLESLSANPAKPEHALAAQVKLAEIRLSQGDIGKAAAIVSGILEKDRRNVDGLRLRASLRINDGKLDEAIADLREALNDRPQSTELLLLMGMAYERSGSIELADDHFGRAVKASKYNPAVTLDYVAFLRRRGGADRAEDIVIDLAERWPQNVEVLSALAQVRLARRDWDGAQRLAEAIRRIGDDKGLGAQILSTALAAQNKHEESIAVLQSAYAASPETTGPMVSLVRAYVAAKEHDKAASFLRSVLQANPNNAEAHVLLGSLHVAKGDAGQAVASFKAAIKKQPQSVSGYAALADFYVKQNDSEHALEVTRAGLQALPDNAGLRINLAQLLEAKGDYDAAISEYEQVLWTQPGSMIAANNLASLLSDHRADDKSLERAYALASGLRKSQVPQFKDTLGWVHYRRGEYRAALALLERAAIELPGLAVVHYHLGATYVALGETAKGSEQLKKALELAPAGSDIAAKIRAALKEAEAT